MEKFLEKLKLSQNGLCDLLTLMVMAVMIVAEIARNESDTLCKTVIQ